MRLNTNHLVSIFRNPKKMRAQVHCRLYDGFFGFFNTFKLRQKKYADHKKYLVFKDEMSWLDLSFYKLRNHAILRGILILPIKSKNVKQQVKINVDRDNYTSIQYDGINLYEACVCSISADLQLFKNEINPDIDSHLNCIRKWYAEAVETILTAQHQIDKIKPDGVIVFQGMLLRSYIFAHVSRRRNIKTAALECSSISNKIIWDASSGTTIGTKSVSESFAACPRIRSAEENELYCSDFVKNIRLKKSNQHLSGMQELETIKPDRKKILFLGQVYTDSSIITGLRNAFINPVQIIKNMHDYCGENGIHLIIKLHPKEAFGVDPAGSRLYNHITSRRLKQALDIDPGFCTVDDANAYDTYDLISKSDAVVTVNSQAGLEALAFGKPVVLCGESFYGNMGLTLEAHSFSELRNCLVNALHPGWMPDNPEAKAFIRYYFEEYCIKNSYEDLALFLENFLKADPIQGNLKDK